MEKAKKSLETELALRNKEVLELKCSLMEKSQEMKEIAQKNSKDFHEK